MDSLEIHEVTESLESDWEEKLLDEYQRKERDEAVSSEEDEEAEADCVQPSDILLQILKLKKMCRKAEYDPNESLLFLENKAKNDIVKAKLNVNKQQKIDDYFMKLYYTVQDITFASPTRLN